MGHHQSDKLGHNRVTTQPIGEARLCCSGDDQDERELTQDEWSAEVLLDAHDSKYYKDGSLAAYGPLINKPWIIMHGASALDSAHRPVPACITVQRGATVRDVMQLISDMTVREGRHAIAGSVYFEGLLAHRRRSGGVLGQLLMHLRC